MILTQNHSSIRYSTYFIWCNLWTLCINWKSR